MGITVRGLSVEFRRRGLRALDRVDLTVATGERIALLGPSGAGKSTLLRCLLGAVPATGTVTVDGLDPYGRDRRRARLAAGFVRQGGDLVPGVSARLNMLAGTVPYWRAADWCRVATGRVPGGWADRLAELVDRHGVTDCLPVPVDRLSGGQRQRVALIRALLPAPRLLLADEPTAGLDPVTAAEAVRALHDPVATVVVATHDPRVAAGFDRVVALRAGRLVYDGAPPTGAAAVGLYRDPVP